MKIVLNDIIWRELYLPPDISKLTLWRTLQDLLLELYQDIKEMWREEKSSRRASSNADNCWELNEAALRGGREALDERGERGLVDRLEI